MKSVDIFSILMVVTMFKTATTFPSDPPTTFPTTIPYDPCSTCRDAPVQYTDIWAGQCVPRGEDVMCRCECLSIFCRENEVIDTTTCRADGSIFDFRCIPIETTTIQTTFPSEPTTFPTTIPYDPCSTCRDAPVQYTDIWAGQCVPRGEDVMCRCECLSIFCRENEVIDTTTCRADGSIFDCRCKQIETTTVQTTFSSEPTTFPTTIPYDPCSTCRDAPVQYTDIWAGQCVPRGEDVMCRCECLSIFCRENEVIDTTTCRADGSIFDCRCIPIETTTVQTTFPSEPTTFPTTIPYDPCSTCRDAPVQYTDIWAGQCVPRGEDVMCRCECLSIFCRENEVIDTTTCRTDGSIFDCRCIPIETTTVQTTFPSEPTTFPTTIPYDPCSTCRDAPVQYTDIWAGQCVPRGEDVMCRCECLSIFCLENEVIDTTTCRADGSIFDCRCIPIETTTVQTTFPSEPTTFPTTIPYDPCSTCRDAPVQYTDIWAGQCVPRGEDVMCRCECLSIYCRENEVIDTTTCRADGSIFDCRCIPIETTTVQTTFPSEPTTFPTTIPYDPCSTCLDAPVQYTDIWAGQCVPRAEDVMCRCECLSIFCRENEVIDTTTCRADGNIFDCRCISIETTIATTN